MKRTIFALSTMLVVFVAVFAVLAVHPLRTVKAHHGCSKATLKGNYGVVAQGVGASYITPVNFSVLITFDGEGHLSGTNFNEVVGPNLYAWPQIDTGATYTVNSDCTCTISNVSVLGLFPDTTIDAYGIIVGGGDELIGNLNTPTGSEYLQGATFRAKKVQDSD